MPALLRISLIASFLWMAAAGFLPSLPFSIAIAQTTQPSGGFLEQAGSAIRSRWTTSQLQAFLPGDRGKFIFPAPYNTEGVRLTNFSDCGGTDCLWYVGYSYWRNSNNHVGSNQMLIFLSFNKSLGGAGPTLFSYDKTTDQVTKVGPLFEASSPYTWYTGEGWYFSATLPTTLYMYDGPRMLRYAMTSCQNNSQRSSTSRRPGARIIESGKCTRVTTTPSTPRPSDR